MYFKILLLINILINVSTYNIKIKQQDLPEYSEYLRQNSSNLRESKINIRQSPVSFPQFTALSLCTEPKNDFEHVYCWVMFVIYILMITSLVIYQIRSIIWFKVKLPRQQLQNEV
ncbi:unnamed protein product [Meloidogyne enterolobii]|uniref:Uncharacterized protein n=1 Tax=Meloidogyne enterolobii TaxID=390850 RepID=A0ACB0YH48_MELEN